MSRSIFIGSCEGKQSSIDKIDSLMELVVAEQAISQIAKGIRDGKLGKKVPKKIKEDFLKSYNL